MLERSEIIKKYYEEIRNIFKKSGFHLSYRHLQRILQSLGLKKKNINENLEHIIAAIIHELNGSGQCLG